MALKIVALFAIALLSGCASMSKHELAWQSLHALDVAQTVNSAGSDDPCWREAGIPTKYLIGENPDPESVIAWGVVSSVLHYYAGRWLDRSDWPDGLKFAIRSIDIGNQATIVVQNHREGARPFGDNARTCL
jgi:uncharacterized protein YceK